MIKKYLPLLALLLIPLTSNAGTKTKLIQQMSVYYSINEDENRNYRGMLGLQFGVEKEFLSNLITKIQNEIGYGQRNLDVGISTSIGYKVPLYKNFKMEPYITLSGLYQLNDRTQINKNSGSSYGIGYGAGIEFSINDTSSISLGTKVYDMKSDTYSFKYLKNIIYLNSKF